MDLDSQNRCHDLYVEHLYQHQPHHQPHRPHCNQKPLPSPVLQVSAVVSLLQMIFELEWKRDGFAIYQFWVAHCSSISQCEHLKVNDNSFIVCQIEQNFTCKSITLNLTCQVFFCLVGFPPRQIGKKT
jgi:hypothetical protein